MGLVQVVESLYGQDLDSGHHGSGFPLPPFRQTLLEQHLTQAAQDKGLKDAGSAASAAQRHFTDKETAYSKHAWNINNLPRCKVYLTQLKAARPVNFLLGQEWCSRLVHGTRSSFCYFVPEFQRKLGFFARLV